MITGGKKFVSAPPAFSNDAKKLLVCTGNTVSVYSTATGLLITELEGHKMLVTSVIVPASTPAMRILCHCWTSSLDGTICYWDFSLPELMKKVDIRLPIFSMVIPNVSGPAVGDNGKPVDTYAYISVEDITKPDDEAKPLARKTSKPLRGKIRKCNLTKSRLIGGLTLAETQQPEAIIISPSRNFFGIVSKRKLTLWKVPDKETDNDVLKKMVLHHTKNFTVLAFHPTEKTVAAGDVTGRILIWKNFGKRTFSRSVGASNGRILQDEEERPGVRGDDDAECCSTWHWHSAGVMFLTFSSTGESLYSGGKEGVLVVWQVDTGKKTFLPRIGSPLLFFTHSPDPSLCSTSCADNQIHLLKMPAMEILNSISGIKPPCSFPKIYEGLCGGAVFDQTAGLVAIQTEDYCVQVYSLFDDREVSQVRICERNHQPGDDTTLVVTSLALSVDGSKMGTVEVKLPEEGVGGLVCLKFWASGSMSEKFKLSTVIYEPHSDAGISALAFHPTRPMAVSSSYGGDFKIWVCDADLQQKDQMHQKTGWGCHSVGSYKKQPMTAATFSADGSVLAVAAGTDVTLWDPDRNILVAVIGESLMPIVSLSFVGNSEHFVSISQGSEPQLSVWSMLKLSVSWSCKLQAEAVACMRDASLFAVLALRPKSSKRLAYDGNKETGEDGVIILFNVENPIPLSTWSVNKAKGGGLAFLQADLSLLDKMIPEKNDPQALLAYISGDHEYVLFDPYSREDHKIQKNHPEKIIPQEETGNFGYASIYGELRELEFRKDHSTEVSYAPSEKLWETIFSGSSHMLPPLTKLCPAFLESFLEKRPVIQE